MLYGLQQGQTERQIIEASLKRTGTLPDAIANAPELLPGLELYLEAFYDLNGDRSYGFSPGPIPRRAIRQYAEEIGMDDFDDFQRFAYIIKEIDAAYLKHLDEKINKGKGK